MRIILLVALFLLPSFHLSITAAHAEVQVTAGDNAPTTTQTEAQKELSKIEEQIETLERAKKDKSSFDIEVLRLEYKSQELQKKHLKKATQKITIPSSLKHRTPIYHSTWDGVAIEKLSIIDINAWLFLSTNEKMSKDIYSDKKTIEESYKYAITMAKASFTIYPKKRAEILELLQNLMEATKKYDEEAELAFLLQLQKGDCYSLASDLCEEYTKEKVYNDKSQCMNSFTQSKCIRFFPNSGINAGPFGEYYAWMTRRIYRKEMTKVIIMGWLQRAHHDLSPPSPRK